MNELVMIQAAKCGLLDRRSRGGLVGLRAGTALALCFGTMLSWGSQAPVVPNAADGPAATELARYRAELQAFRAEFGGSRELPDAPFSLFGMGKRAKLLYKAGSLVSATAGKVLQQWPAKTSTIVPPAYCVAITTASGASIRIVEDEQAVSMEENGIRHALEGTQHPVRLPAFKEYRYPQVLRVLHQELLVTSSNINQIEPTS